MQSWGEGAASTVREISDSRQDRTVPSTGFSVLSRRPCGSRFLALGRIAFCVGPVRNSFRCSARQWSHVGDKRPTARVPRWSSRCVCQRGSPPHPSISTISTQLQRNTSLAARSGCLAQPLLCLRTKVEIAPAWAGTSIGGTDEKCPVRFDRMTARSKSGRPEPGSLNQV